MPHSHSAANSSGQCQHLPSVGHAFAPSPLPLGVGCRPHECADRMRLPPYPHPAFLRKSSAHRPPFAVRHLPARHHPPACLPHRPSNRIGWLFPACQPAIGDMGRLGHQLLESKRQQKEEFYRRILQQIKKIATFCKNVNL